MMPSMLTPSTETEAADLIRDHASRNTSLQIRGGGSRAGFGNPVAAEAVLSSAALSGIVEYNPAEMVITARVGTPVAEIEAALAENGQAMAFEPMDHRGAMGTSGTPTIGGLFAVNSSGPRRITAGAARDQGPFAARHQRLLLGVIAPVGEIRRRGEADERRIVRRDVGGIRDDCIEASGPDRLVP